MVVRVASFLPFQTTYYLNGHSFIEQELKRAGIGFRKQDNAFLVVDDVAALQAAADRLSPEIIRRRLDYWTLILGPKFSKKERAKLNLSRFYAISQIEYCRNFIFRRHFPIHKLFERSCELGLWRLSADKIATIFGKRVSRRMHGKLAMVIDQIEHGHHVFRAYFKSGFLKQYEKFLTFLRNELVSNNLTDFGLRKGLDHLDAVRTTFQAITDRFAGFQAEWLNVHVDFPLLQRLAHPITIGAVRYPGLKIHEPRVTYRLNQLRYDLRKLKGHGLIERDGSRYAYRVSPKGVQVALLFLFFHKRLCGSLVNSRFHHRPDPQYRPDSRLEWEVAVERPTYHLTVFKLHCGKLTLKIYSKGERVLRIEAVAQNIREFHCGRLLHNFPEIVRRLRGMLERFMEALSCIDQCFIGDEMLERLPLPSRVGKSMVGGIDLNKPRLRHVTEAIIALSASPDGFTASALADQVRALGNQSLSAYGPRQAAYDLKKLRGKQIVRRIGSTRRYEPLPSGLRAITALLVLRNKAIKPLLAAAQEIAPNNGGQNPRAIDRYYLDLQRAMQGVFHELGIAA